MKNEDKVEIKVWGIDIEIEKKDVLGYCEICGLPVVSKEATLKNSNVIGEYLLFDLSLYFERNNNRFVHEICVNLDEEERKAYFNSKHAPEEISSILS